MSGYRDHIAAAIQATTFHSPTVYSWFGKLSPRLPASVRRRMTARAARSYLHFRLQSQLYSDFYCQGRAAPAKQEIADASVTGVTPFVQELSAANDGCGSCEDDWEILASYAGELIVRRSGLALTAREEDCVMSNGGQVAVGARVRLRLPKEFLAMSPGFYMALGDGGLPDDRAQGVVRWYWNLTADNAVRFVRRATSLLNRTGLRFKLKALDDPARYTRCDAVVLYVRAADHAHVAEILAALYPEVAAGLKQGTPVFTKPVAEGVGLAESPDRGESFGLHRCGILAEGMIRANEQRQGSDREAMRVIEAHFADHGISLDAPFLNPGSSDVYPFRVQPRGYARPARAAAAGGRALSTRNTFLRTADEIGRRLAREAVWHGERCNWLGVALDEPVPANGAPRVRYSPLGPDLYSGTSGVALFAAELFAATGGSDARHTALGAMRHALSRVEAIPSPARLGLYTGWSGIALAAARVGTLVRDEELLRRAKHLVQRIGRERQGHHEFDVLSGRAGAIVALLIFRDILNEPALIELAVRQGDKLLRDTDKTDLGYSWKSRALPTRRNLTGLSHGAAGAACALLELFRATGDARYRDTAERAFAYERHWFDAAAGNWPDFREEADQPRSIRRPMSFAATWCHGAPGIALTRLRAYQVLRDETYRAEARIALHTTRNVVEMWLRSGTGNFSLCHGLAGNADVLLDGSEVFGRASTLERRCAFEVASAGIELYGRRRGGWPCGTGGGETPNLMLGWAGIGYFYLRMCTPTIPSILMLRPEQFSSGRAASASVPLEPR